MMYRAFLPLKVDRKSNIASELDAFPSWLVSFDGKRFIEVTQKPSADNISLLRILWSVSIDGPRKKRRKHDAIMPQTISRELVDRFAEAVEEIPETEAELMKLPIRPHEEGTAY